MRSSAKIKAKPSFTIRLGGALVRLQEFSGPIRALRPLVKAAEAKGWERLASSGTSWNTQVTLALVLPTPVSALGVNRTARAATVHAIEEYRHAAVM